MTVSPATDYVSRVHGAYARAIIAASTEADSFRRNVLCTIARVRLHRMLDMARQLDRQGA